MFFFFKKILCLTNTVITLSLYFTQQLRSNFTEWRSLWHARTPPDQLKNKHINK